MSELTEAVEAARQAFAAATNLEELAVARREHLGDDAPISQARRALGSLPKRMPDGLSIRRGARRRRRTPALKPPWRRSGTPRF